MSITAVILAAGANTRLNGLVPSFRKPLLLVNGKPLFHHALDFARDQKVESIVVVASPHNVADLISITPTAYRTYTRWVIQPEPTNVLDAVQIGVEMVLSSYTFILCADNTFEGDFTLKRSDCGFGARHIPWPASQRFTRYRIRDGKTQIIDAASTEHGEGCWIGPLLLRTDGIQTTLRALARNGSFNGISMASLIQLSAGQHNLEPVMMQCSDMGIPQEWEERRSESDRRTNA